MWAFALWDDNKQQLLLSRDRIGEKPLNYAIFDNTLVFGSEIKSILAYGLPKISNLELLEIYLSLGYIPAPFTFYKNIYKLKAGHCLIVCGGVVKEQQYWDLPEIDENNMFNNKNEIYEHFEYLLKDSVKIRMRSDVPYGAFLSGGLDSSSIVALMSEISSFPIETFTIGFKEKSYDERHLAMLVANKFCTNHHEYIVEPDTFQESLNNIVYHYDEPFGDSSAIPIDHLSKFAHTKVKMILTGDGGDEVLSGYTIYQGEKFASKYNKLPGLVRRGLPTMLTQISRPFKGSIRYKLNRIQNVCHTSTMDFESRYLNKVASLNLSIIKEISNGVQVYPIEQFLSEFMKKCTYKDSFYRLMYIDLKLSLPDKMLVKIDRMCMANSLESRAPFLDHRLIEYMTNVQKDIKMIHFKRKIVLRNSIGQKLPKPLLEATKRGFGVPLREWFKDASFTEKINDFGKNISFLNKKVIRKVVEMNKNGEKDSGEFIWMLFILNKTLMDG
jgi:asparagine synthase (glutamine-hydrolysing)